MAARPRTTDKPTITDVARRAGVSKSLVSLVMRNERHVSARRREAVRKAATALGYRPNAMARSLKQRHTGILGVMVSDLHNPFFADVVDGIHDQAARSGYRVLIDTANPLTAQQDDAIETLLELRVDGLILAGLLAESRVIVEAGREVPVVLVGRAARGPFPRQRDQRRLGGRGGRGAPLRLPRPPAHRPHRRGPGRRGATPAGGGTRTRCATCASRKYSTVVPGAYTRGGRPQRGAACCWSRGRAPRRYSRPTTWPPSAP